MVHFILSKRVDLANTREWTPEASPLKNNKANFSKTKEVSCKIQNLIPTKIIMIWSVSVAQIQIKLSPACPKIMIMRLRRILKLKRRA